MGRGWVYFSMQLGVSASGSRGCTPPSADTRWTHTPWANTPNWADTPPGQTPIGRHPLDRPGHTSPWADIPLDTYPPWSNTHHWAEAHLGRHPPRQNRHLLVRHPPGQTPPKQTSSCRHLSQDSH